MRKGISPWCHHVPMSDDSAVERASEWIASEAGGVVDIGMLGAPSGRSSISPSSAWATPPAFREALRRFPTWDAGHQVDVSKLSIRDFGDVEGDASDPDATGVHSRIERAMPDLKAACRVPILVGGDNSITRPAMLGLAGEEVAQSWGLITFDAHHDTREVVDGMSRNGTPVRELIDAGLPANRIAQIGIHEFGNSESVARWAYEQGIHIHSMSQVRRQGVARVYATALDQVRSSGAKRIYVDFDIDVLDRALAPACPASMPGGMSAEAAAEGAFLAGATTDVAAFDLTEVDALQDVAGITLRAMCHVFMSFCAGVATR